MQLARTRLKEKLSKLEEEVKRLAAIGRALLASPDSRMSLTDPDFRSMATSGTAQASSLTMCKVRINTTKTI